MLLISHKFAIAVMLLFLSAFVSLSTVADDSTDRHRFLVKVIVSAFIKFVAMSTEASDRAIGFIK
jgi:hypothetical protein